MQTFERDLPGQNTAGFNTKYVSEQLPLESCNTLNDSWGFNIGDSKFKSPEEPGALVPAGAKSGGTYTSGLTNSGIIGPAPFFPSATFTLKFGKAGTYEYVCVLHPGMKGTVTVT